MNAVRILLSVLDDVKVYSIGVDPATGAMVREAAIPLKTIKEAINNTVIEEVERLYNVEEGVQPD